MIRNFFFWVTFIFAILGGLLVGPIFSIFSRREEFYHRVVVVASKLMLWIGGVKVAISGLDNIPRGKNVIFAANHQSLIDILICLAHLPGYFHFAVMQQAYDVPFIRAYMKRAGYVRVDLRNSREAMLAMIKLAKLLGRGESVMIFPEGTRSYDGKLQEFKDGVSMLILQGKRPVVPMVISGSIRTMHRSELKIHPGSVKVKIGKPIAFDEFQEVNLDNAKIISSRLRETIGRLMHEGL